MKKSQKISGLFLGLLFAILNLSYGQSKIDDYLSEITKLKSFSGTVLVAEKGNILLHKGYGYADYEQAVPNTAQSVHRIGSLTKPITAMGILKLFSTDDSRSIRDSIGKYIPNLPIAWKPITIFQLLTHTSGIPNHFGDLEAVPVENTYQELEKVFEKEKNSPLKNSPGTVYSYNNFGYVILGRIIEIVSGEPYIDYLSQSNIRTIRYEAYLL